MELLKRSLNQLISDVQNLTNKSIKEKMNQLSVDDARTIIEAAYNIMDLFTSLLYVHSLIEKYNDNQDKITELLTNNDKQFASEQTLNNLLESYLLLIDELSNYIKISDIPALGIFMTLNDKIQLNENINVDEILESITSELNEMYQKTIERYMLKVTDEKIKEEIKNKLVESIDILSSEKVFTELFKFNAREILREFFEELLLGKSNKYKIEEYIKQITEQHNELSKIFEDEDINKISKIWEIFNDSLIKFVDEIVENIVNLK